MTIDVDSRFSVVYCLRDGKWKIVHMHQSIPYKDQIEGGYDSNRSRNRCGKCRDE